MLEGVEMEWYNEEHDGSTKRYLEWFYQCELEPDEEPGFYKEVPSTTKGSDPKE